MKKLRYDPCLFIFTCLMATFIACSSSRAESSDTAGESLEQRRKSAKTLNNEGVKDLALLDYAGAVSKLEAALALIPDYKIARANLGVAYNNRGLSLQKKPYEAITYFHHALYLDPQNDTTKANLEGIILKMGKKPDLFSDRLSLGNDAVLAGDFKGGVVEFRAALALKEDQKVRVKLEKTLSKIGSK